jgi:hypothetical protein
MTITPTGAHDGAYLGNLFIVDGSVQVLFGNTPTRRSAQLDPLELALLGDAAADVVNQAAQGSAHGHFDKPMLLISPDIANTLVPLLVSVPTLAYQAPPLIMIWGTLASVSTLLRIVGFSHRALVGRKRRPRPRHSPASFDGAHQGGFFSAYKRAGALVDLDFKIETGAQDILPSNPRSVACSMAICSRLMASGYSVRA